MYFIIVLNFLEICFKNISKKFTGKNVNEPKRRFNSYLSVNRPTGNACSSGNTHSQLRRQDMVYIVLKFHFDNNLDSDQGMKRVFKFTTYIFYLRKSYIFVHNECLLNHHISGHIRRIVLLFCQFGVLYYCIIEKFAFA